eukprot:7446727-Pyramimonas_sp.AAC.1
MAPARRRNLSPEGDRRLSVGIPTTSRFFRVASPRSAVVDDPRASMGFPGMTGHRRRGFPSHLRAAPPARCVRRGSL